MLKKAITDQITDFVRQKPRTVQEVAHTIGKNWRTADRYIDEISKETGTIGVRTFREGTRGALKVVYARLGASSGSVCQEALLNKILQGRRKEDFSPFDIYQFVEAEKKKAFVAEDEYAEYLEIRYDNILTKAERQALFFSGNMSWLDLGDEKVILRQIEQLAKNKISIKVLTKIDITSLRNVKKLMAVNETAGWDAVEVRHSQQPLRGVVIDEKFANLKEVLSPQYFKSKELPSTTYIYYHIEDPEWISWLQKTFWHIFQHSISAKERISALDTLTKLEIK